MSERESALEPAQEQAAAQASSVASEPEPEPEPEREREPEDGPQPPEPQDGAVAEESEASPVAVLDPPVDPVETPQPPIGWVTPDAMAQTAPFAVQSGESGEPGSALLAPTAKKRPSKRFVLISVGIVAALALVAAGIVALLPGRTGNSIVAVAHCRPADLTSCLIKAPAGAIQLDDVATWDHATVVTADLYRANITDDAAGISTDTASLLDSDGLSKAVHRDWNAVDGNNVDLVLLQFNSQKGATSWNAARTGEIMAAYQGRAVSVPGDATGKAFAAAKADAKGNVEAAYSAVVGDLVLNVAYSSPKTLDAKDLQNWAGTELASLQAAPPAAADQPDAAAGTQELACTGGLTSCLAPMPGGSEHWTSPISGDWVRSTTLTSDQFIKLSWDNNGTTQSQVKSNFATDGVTAIAHQDWMTDGGYKQADIYLIQAITAGGAGQLDGSNFGEPNWGKGLHGTSYTIPGEPNAQAWYTNPDSNGFVNFYFGQNIGNVIVHGWFFFSGSLDSGTANRWAQAQLNLVSHTAKSEPMGLYPLTAPGLPASSQGSCPASGDCLLPLPGGATDSTASSYQVSRDLNATVYGSQYEADTSTDFATWLSSDGFASGAHRTWTTSDGASAEAVLLKFGGPAQAQAAARLEYGLNASAGHERVCTDSKLPDSFCLAAPVTVSDPLQKETIRVLAWKGDYEVSVSVTKSNAADVADAYVWAQRQLDLLPAS
ncbi:MAG TPA: hypothetical protein VFU74_11440 [Actinocrinis sp.]|nr:hypothetical protein [Actinocrinis sp.]